MEDSQFRSRQICDITTNAFQSSETLFHRENIPLELKGRGVNTLTLSTRGKFMMHFSRFGHGLGVSTTLTLFPGVDHTRMRGQPATSVPIDMN